MCWWGSESPSPSWIWPPFTLTSTISSTLEYLSPFLHQREQDAVESEKKGFEKVTLGNPARIDLRSHYGEEFPFKTGDREIDRNLFSLVDPLVKVKIGLRDLFYSLERFCVCRTFNSPGYAQWGGIPDGRAP